MSRRFVLDASGTLAWLFDESSGRSQLDPLISDGSAIVPALWRLEVVNTLLVKERQKNLTAEEVATNLMVLESLDPEVADDPPSRTLSQLAALARPHQLSAYDAAYLDLAVRRGLPLLTFDRNLRQAATAVGVSLLGE